MPEGCVILDKRCHVDAVTVLPPGGKGSAAAEANVFLATERFGQGFVDGVIEFARPARKVEFGHQTEMRSTMLLVTFLARRS